MRGHERLCAENQMLRLPESVFDEPEGRAQPEGQDEGEKGFEILIDIQNRLARSARPGVVSFHVPHLFTP